MRAQRILWIGPEPDDGARAFPQSGPVWTLVPGWAQARPWLLEPVAAVVLGLWCPSGETGVPDLDCWQVARYLERHACRLYLVLDPAQQEFAGLGAGRFDRVFLRTAQWWAAGLEQILQDLGHRQRENPLARFHELVYQQGATPQLHLHCPNLDLRSDLLSFLGMKRTALEGALALGPPGELRLMGEEFEALVMFPEADSQLWLARPLGATPEAGSGSSLGWAELEALRERGVSL